MTGTNEGPRTNMDILQMNQDDFVAYIFNMIPQIHVDYDNPDSMLKAGAALGDCANIYAFFVQLKAMSLIGKRYMKRKESEAQDEEEKKRWKRCYEDLLDKETILGDACKTVDIEYRAVNRALTVYIDTTRDRYMPDSITKPQRP